MKLLDLFCCAGGASMGYHQAGFEVTGVDIKDQPSYPFKFIKGDVMKIIKDKDFLNSFDVIHASPPCQGYSNATKPDSIYVHYSQGKDTPKLIEPVRNALINTGKYYIIENVAGAKEYLIEPFRLTGYMFNMPIERTRYFECNFPVAELKNITKRGYSKKYAEDNGIDYRDMSVTGKSRRKGSIDVWRKVMDMPWAGRGWELTEAIPPAYTKYIGEQILKYESNLRIQST
jgi:DNA (cytosine-5)-methyltransferase 1